MEKWHHVCKYSVDWDLVYCRNCLVVVSNTVWSSESFRNNYSLPVHIIEIYKVSISNICDLSNKSCLQFLKLKMHTNGVFGFRIWIHEREGIEAVDWIWWPDLTNSRSILRFPLFMERAIWESTSYYTPKLFCFNSSNFCLRPRWSLSGFTKIGFHYQIQLLSSFWHLF